MGWGASRGVRVAREDSEVLTLKTESLAPHEQEMHDSLKTYLILATRAGVPLTPNTHSLLHMVHRIQREFQLVMS